MREFFIAFRSRQEAVRFFEELTNYNISAKLINTPSSVGIGCGLSVKLFAKDMNMARIVLMRGRYNSQIGIYYLGANGNIIRM